MTLEQLRQAVESHGYVSDEQLLTALWLMITLDRPLLLEGDAGVGKTEVAKSLAAATARPLIRLQCYEGLDVNTAVYEWNYQSQLLAIRLHEAGTEKVDADKASLFSDQYLLKRPLLQAITSRDPPILLIDEIDRADEEFEAFLLELLSDFQISIPEIGTIKAISTPQVVLTSNATRELSDALRRRCLYHFIDYPSFDKELRIVRTRVPEAGEQLSAEVVAFVQKLRREDLRKTPGIAETLDWVAALLSLELDTVRERPEQVAATLGCLLKTREDLEAWPLEEMQRLMAKAG